MSQIILPPSQTMNLGRLKILACNQNPWYFIKKECYTEDPHDCIDNIKLIPDLKYLEYTIEKRMRTKGVLIITKSRQMLITWLMLAFHLWLAIFRVGQRIYIQAQKQEDADELLERLIFIYEHLDSIFRRCVKIIKKTISKINFSNRSQILALAKGGSQIRQKCASAIFTDEFAFQEDADDAYRAMRPTITGGGIITIVSSAETGFMCDLVHDKVVLKNVA